MAEAVKGLFSLFNKSVRKSGKDKKSSTSIHVGNERQEEQIQLFRATLSAETPFINDFWYSGFVVGLESDMQKSSVILKTALDGLDSRSLKKTDIPDDQVLKKKAMHGQTEGKVSEDKGKAIRHDVTTSESKTARAEVSKNEEDGVKIRIKIDGVDEEVQVVKLRSRSSRRLDPDSAVSGKEKDEHDKQKNRLSFSNFLQDVRKSTASWTSRDSGVASSVSDSSSVSLEWIGDDDDDYGWDDDEFSDDSDFDDDVYEDFENRISMLEITDRQTEDMPCRIAIFILQTEMEYIQQLSTLVKILSALAEVIKKHKGSDSGGYLKEMSTRATSILQFHNEFFLPALKTRLTEWKSKPQIGDIMKSNAPFFKLYRSYMLPFEHSVPVVAAWKKDPKKFSSLIKDIKKMPECDNVPFQNFMWYPMKRLRLMEFLLTAYLKNIPDDSEETKDIKETLRILSESKQYPKKVIRKKTMHKVKHDIRQLKNRSQTPPPPITEELPSPEERPTREDYPEDRITPTDKSQRIILELLATERSYVRKLQLMHKIEQQFRQENTIPDDIIKEIFSKLESILVFHSKYLLPQIEERAINWETNKRIGDVMKTSAPFLKIYAEYIQNYENAKHQIETWKKKSSKFSSVLLEMMNSQESGGIPLDGHLLEPVQRVPRYELLLKEYIKSISEDSEDKQDAEDALKLVMEAASHSNQFLKKMTLKGTKFDFSVPDRELLKEGFVTFISPGTCEKQRRILFLFSDVLILCSEALFGKFNVTSQIELSDLKIMKAENPVVPDTFILMGKSETVELQNSDEVNIDWFEEISNILKNIGQKRSSFIVDSECPASPDSLDDKSLSTSLQINRDEIGKRAPRLKPFQTANKCMRCRTKFNNTKKYNCKACGFVICGKCSRQVKLEYRNMKTGRVCYECYLLLHTDSDSQNSDNNEEDM